MVAFKSVQVKTFAWVHQKGWYVNDSFKLLVAFSSKGGKNDDGSPDKSTSDTQCTGIRVLSRIFSLGEIEIRLKIDGGRAAVATGRSFIGSST